MYLRQIDLFIVICLNRLFKTVWINFFAVQGLFVRFPKRNIVLQKRGNAACLLPHPYKIDYVMSRPCNKARGLPNIFFHDSYDTILKV